MITVRNEVRINAPKNKVWDIISDFPTVMNYNPLITSSYNINDTTHRGYGAERTCEFDAAGKKFVNERVTRYTEGESYDVEIYAGTQLPPVNNLLATIAVREISRGQTELSVKMTYAPKANPMMWLMAHTMIKKFMAGAIDGILNGAKVHIETGKRINSRADLHPALATAS